MHQFERAFHARYYTETAHVYNQMHVGIDEHARALEYMNGLLSAFEFGSVLDVGSGTGRAISFLKQHHPERRIVGTELIAALLEQAKANGSVAGNDLVQCSGYNLPFSDGSFDVVCEFGMLHHVRDPDSVVQEMTRVARRAVFISDSNRFGQGRYWIRVFKLALATCGLWSFANFVKNGGRAYMISNSDGLSYSYSVFDSFDRLATWADRIVVIPTGTERARSWVHPLLTSSHVLLAALRFGSG